MPLLDAKGNVIPSGGMRTESAAPELQSRGVQVSAALLAELVEAESEDLPELIGKMETDYQVQLADIVLRANLAAADVQFSPESPDPRADAICDKLKLLWDRSLGDMGNAMKLGRVAFEKVWEYDAAGTFNYIDKLVPLPHRNTRLLLWKADDPTTPNDAQGRPKVGSFQGIELWGKEPQDSIKLPPFKSWWLAMDATDVRPHGESLWLGAFEETWKERRAAIKIRKTFIRRFVVNGGVCYAPSTTKDQQGRVIDVIKAIGQGFLAKVSGGLWIIPNDRDKAGNRLIDYAEAPEIVDPAPLDAHIDGLDSEQLLSIGIPPKTIMEGTEVGSYALVTQQMLILFAVSERILNQNAASFERYVVAPHAGPVNFAAGRCKIRMVITPLSKRSDALVTELVKQIIASPQLSPLIMSGAMDIRKMFETAGIPMTPNAEQALQAYLGNAAAVAQPAGPAVQLADPQQAPALPILSAVPVPPDGGERLLTFVGKLAKRRLSTGVMAELLAASFPWLAEDRIRRIVRDIAARQAELNAAGLPWERSQEDKPGNRPPAGQRRAKGRLGRLKRPARMAVSGPAVPVDGPQLANGNGHGAGLGPIFDLGAGLP